MSSPYKPSQFLQKIITDGIGLILVTHLDEFDEIAHFVKENSVQNIGIRLRSPRPNRQIGISMQKNTIHEITTRITQTENLNLTTLQLHTGTQLDNQIFKDGIQHILNIANLLESEGITISQLDFGGGFPEASNLSENELEDLFILLFETLNARGWKRETCIFEPGRYIIADAGLLLTEVSNVFKVQNKPWIMLNTGTHHCPKFSNSKFRFEIIHRMSAPHNTPTSIAGCLPTDMDVFTKSCPLPGGIKKGDHLAIFNAGAYTFTWATHFSYPYPPMILIKGSEMLSIDQPKIT